MNRQALLLYLILAFGSQYGCTETSLPVFPVSEGACQSNNLPVLIQPEEDIRSGNDLLATYCKAEITPQGLEMKISYVFRDELHPSIWKDRIYRMYRKFKYGRTMDIESVLVRWKANGDLEEIDLKNVYSGDQVFRSDPVRHYDSVLKPAKMEFRNLRPVLFVNTWNHMFGEKDTNPQLPKMEILDTELKYGSRESLDGYFRGDN